MNVELIRPERHWYDDRRRLAALADWLTEQGREPDDWRHFFEEPWHWRVDYDQMCREEEEQRWLDEQIADEQRAFEREGRYS